ncbi:magnesium transporter [Zavarzinella formosa]|uniref:magnesium transporter n=1 Tax=Zavarzinella formosa TaxID=360055 RepID=UPI0002F82422|nr:magnesium transporter [Zavarzinella formosa]
MPSPLQTQQLRQNIVAHVKKDFVTFPRTMTVGEAADYIRNKVASEAIQYFYVVDEQDKLVGVLPLRRLITSGQEKTLAQVMISRIVAVPYTATVMEAAEFFVLYRLLSLPVVDGQRGVVGVIDVSQFTNEMIDLQSGAATDNAFEALGFRLTQVRGASPLTAFRFRFPWLLASIGSGVMCAVLTSVFEVTLAKSIVLAFFMALVLGLGESVSIQSMSVVIQTLKIRKPTRKWYLRELSREMTTALMLGLACGGVVAGIVMLWRGDVTASLVVGGGICGSLLGACFFGLSVPALLHAIKLDPKIAAGPITLALTDVVTLVTYFGLACLLFK